MSGKIMAMFNLAGMSAEQYDQLLQNMEAAGVLNMPGRLSHVASVTEEGIVAVDVWESAEALQQFAGTLIPMLQQVGVTPSSPKIYPVYNMM